MFKIKLRRSKTEKGERIYLCKSKKKGESLLKTLVSPKFSFCTLKSIQKSLAVNSASSP